MSIVMGRFAGDGRGVASGFRARLLLFLWLFLTICAYYILRPVRSALVLSTFGPQTLPWVYLGTAVVTGLATWVYTRFTHLPRKLFISGTLSFFAVGLLGWWGVFRTGYAWLSPGFYVWTDVFSIMGVTVFWMYATDIYRPADAKRFFGLIGSAGPAGALAGAGLTSLLVKRLGAVDMLLAAAFLNCLLVMIVWVLEFHMRGVRAARAGPAGKSRQNDLSGFVPAMRAICSSRLLFLLALVVCCERLLPDIVDYIFNVVVSRSYQGRDSLAAFFAGFEFWRNALVAIGTLLLTSRILRRGGVSAALLSVPATVLAGCLAFFLMPALALAVVVKGLEEGQRHAWFKTGKEVVYSAAGPEVAYKLKGYIEMFLYRLSRGMAGLLILLLTRQLHWGVDLVALAAVPLAAVWLIAARRLGAEYEALEAETPKC